MDLLPSIVLMSCFISFLLTKESIGTMTTGYQQIFVEGSTNTQIRRESKHRLLKRSVTTTSFVDIARYTQGRNKMRDYSIYVDSTIKRLIIEIEGDRSTPKSALEKPFGAPGPNATLKGTSNAKVTASFDVAINSADYGLWKLKKYDAGAWDVKIQAESTIDFTYQFLEGTRNQTPIQGNPIQGEIYKTLVTVTDISQIMTVNVFFVFLTEKLTPADIKSPVVAKGGGKYEYQKLKMLDRGFMLGIQGIDKSRKTFRRIQFVKPIALFLSVPKFNDPATTLHEHMKLDIPFTVTNKFKTDQKIRVTITDTGNLAVVPNNLTSTLKPGETFTGKFDIDGGHLGDETIVMITVQRLNGTRYINVWPSVQRKFTVESNKTTTTSTSTTHRTTSTTSTLVTSTSPKSLLNSSLTSAFPARSSSNTVSIGNPIHGSHKQTTSVTFAQTRSKGSSSGTMTTTHAHSSNTVSINNQLKIATPSSENEDKKSFSTDELFGAAAITGLCAGVTIGLAALVAVCLVFRHFNKKKIAPTDDKSQRTSSRDIQWT